jgi:hypothetical protein
MIPLLRVAVIYKITYPNGKIYVGQDRTNDCNYFGSADSTTIAADFTRAELRDMTIRKQILATLRNVTIQDVNRCERAWIQRLRSTDPAVGYNRVPGIARQRLRETRCG